MNRIAPFRPRLRAAFFLLVGLLVSSGRLQADDLLVDDGSATNIASGDNLYVNATIGLTTSNNQLNVLNAGTLVSASGQFLVGAGGSSNSMVISNNGSVSAGTLTISGGPGTNSVVVSSGSLQVAGTLNVGPIGKGTLQVQGGLVTARNLVATNWNNGSFLNNSVILLSGGELSAEGATILNGLDFFIGDENGATSATYAANGGTHTFGAGVFLGRSSGNRLLVTSGASLTNNKGRIGFGSGASSNSVVVEGINSAWNNAADLHVGSEGSSNSLVISNSGRVQSADGFVGFTNSSSNNSVLITGGSGLNASAWTLQNNLYVGNGGSGNSVVISSSGSVQSDDGGLFIGNNTNSTNNSLAVTDSGDAYFGADLYIGYDGSGNSMTIGSGGSVSSEFGVYLGWGNNSSNNIITVTNGGNLSTTTLQSGIYFAIGNGGSGNSLVISNGGSVSSMSDSAIGNDINSANNRVLVTGAGSTWTNRGNLIVGNNGSGNSLVISNGGSVQVSSLSLYDGYIGNGSSSSGNSVLVTENSSLSIPYNLHVGYAGQGNSLTVANGGEVQVEDFLKIATQPGSSGTLNIGSYGGNDAAGALLISQIEFGAGTGAINFNQTNAVTLLAGIFRNGIIRQLGTGTTTVYNQGGSFGGSLEVLAGTLVMSNTTSDPSISGGVSNIVVGAGGTLQAAGPWGISIALDPGTSGVLSLNGGNVSGPINFGAGTGAVHFNQTNALTNASAFSGSGTISQLGAGTTTLTEIQTNFTGSLFVSAGTLVLKPAGFPFALGGTNIMVTGGARLRVGDDHLFVLGYTNSSGLVISNGGGFESYGSATIGSTDSLNNSLLVTGVGSTWTNSGDLQFGNESSGNNLVISNGGRVANLGIGNTCYVGYSGSFPVTKTSNNSVLVTDINSTWDIQGILGVGGYGHGNRLVISNGGSVLSQQGGVGLGNNPDLHSSNSSVLVTGAGSMWSNSQTLRVASGGGNSLTVADGGSVYAQGGIIIEGESAYDDPGGALNIGRLGSNDAGGTITGAIHLGSIGALLNFNQTNSAIVGNLITGSGNLRQRGTGVTTLTAYNTFTGSVRVSGGTLRLESAAGSALGSVTNITVDNGTLVLAANSQIKTNAGVTLFRGTFVLGDGVTQSLSSLTLASGNNSSTLDFGASGVSSLNFGNYQTLTTARLKLQNFTAGNSFAFTLPDYQIHSFSNYFEIVGDYVSHTTQTGQDTYNVISLGTQQYVDWTHSYDLDPTAAAGPTAGTPAADPDGDGFDNYEEYAFGGNPTVGTPALLAIASSTITFIGLKSAPSSYSVQNTTNLATGSWTNYPVALSNTAPPFPIPQPDSYQGMGFNVPLTPGTNNFYRVIFSNQ